MDVTAEIFLVRAHKRQTARYWHYIRQGCLVSSRSIDIRCSVFVVVHQYNSVSSHPDLSELIILVPHPHASDPCTVSSGYFPYTLSIRL